MQNRKKHKKKRNKNVATKATHDITNVKSASTHVCHDVENLVELLENDFAHNISPSRVQALFPGCPMPITEANILNFYRESKELMDEFARSLFQNNEFLAFTIPSHYRGSYGEFFLLKVCYIYESDSDYYGITEGFGILVDKNGYISVEYGEYDSQDLVKGSPYYKKTVADLVPYLLDKSDNPANKEVSNG